MARRNVAMKLLDERWDLIDQLIQLKGVVEFNERNKIWLQVKEDLIKKNYDSKIKHVASNVKRLRAMIRKYELGYVDEMDEVLRQDKEVHLICRKKPPEVIIDTLKHMIFRQRKSVDKIKCEIRNSKKELFEVELNIAALKDKVNSGQEFVKNKEREENEKYSAALEYANTQNDVCCITLECYKKIIGVLKKDSLFFDDVISNLNNDATIQSQTILKIIELGQLACEDFGWLRQEAKRKAVRFNMDIEPHRKEIKECGEAIEILERMVAKLNEYGASAYPVFQKDNKEPEKDPEYEELKKKYEEFELIFGKMKNILGVYTVPEVFSEMEKLNTINFQLEKVLNEQKTKRDAQITDYVQTKALAIHLQHFIPEEVKGFIKEEEAIRADIDMTAQSFKEVKAIRDRANESKLYYKNYLLNMKRLLWSVDIGQPAESNLMDDDKEDDSDFAQNYHDREDPFGLFGDTNETVSPPASPVDNKGGSSGCESEEEDIPFRLMDLVKMKAQVLHDSVGEQGAQDDIDPKILEAYGDALAEEDAIREEYLKKVLDIEKLVVRQYKPKFEEVHNQGCEKKKRLEIKFMSRQLVVDNEIAKEKGEIRFHLHPQGVYRGMYIEADSESSESEPEDQKAKDEGKEHDEESDVPEEESDIGYEPSEDEQIDSDLDPNEPKPHICY